MDGDDDDKSTGAAVRAKARRYRANVRRLRARLRRMDESSRAKCRRMIDTMQAWLDANQRAAARA